MIRYAGHMVPHDRPLVAQALSCLLFYNSVPRHKLLLLLIEGLLVLRSSHMGTVGLAYAEGLHWHKVIYELDNKRLLVSSALCRLSLQCPGANGFH